MRDRNQTHRGADNEPVVIGRGFMDFNFSKIRGDAVESLRSGIVTCERGLTFGTRWRAVAGALETYNTFRAIMLH